MARQGRSTRRPGRRRSSARGAASTDVHPGAVHEDDALAMGAEEAWHGEPEWSATNADEKAARRRPRHNGRVHTPAWQLIDRYREDKWLRERIKEVYDD